MSVLGSYLKRLFKIEDAERTHRYLDIYEGRVYVAKFLHN